MIRPGAAAHTCNPSTLGGGSPELRNLRQAWPTWQNPVPTKNTKISWAWRHMPVVSATWEAEAEKLLKPGRRRLHWAEIVPLPSSLVTEQDSVFKKKVVCEDISCLKYLNYKAQGSKLDKEATLSTNCMSSSWEPFGMQWHPKAESKEVEKNLSSKQKTEKSRGYYSNFGQNRL